VGAQWRWSPTAQVTAGGASVFERLDQEWVLEQDLGPADPGEGDLFGSSAAVSGDLIVIGAPQDDDESIESSGSTYVFSRVDGEWVELQKLVPFAASSWQQFGWSVALAGPNLLVGAPGFGAEGAWWTGGAYLFRPAGDSWAASAVLVPGGAAPDDQLGEVGISGHTAVLGARLADVDGRPDAGAASVFLLP
jgi:hypothetical protein